MYTKCPEVPGALALRNIDLVNMLFEPEGTINEKPSISGCVKRLIVVSRLSQGRLLFLCSDFYCSYRFYSVYCEGALLQSVLLQSCREVDEGTQLSCGDFQAVLFSVTAITSLF